MNDEDVNVWLLPSDETILVTDQTGGVPVDACDWPEHLASELKEKLGEDYRALWHFKGENSWRDAVNKANELKDKLGCWSIQYDNWIGRECENDEDF